MRNTYVSHFFATKTKTKKHDVLEDPKSNEEEEQKLLPGAPNRSDNPPRGVFWDPGFLLGGRGGTTRKQHADYLTRPWAKGPANLSGFAHSAGPG